jgi:anaphase-promoting complex subunit 5
MPGRTLLDVFLKNLWEINSFDALHDLFNRLGDLLVKEGDESDPDGAVDHFGRRILLSKSSPLGAFVRRARLEFTRLQFDDAMKLWSSLIAYRAPTAKWTKRIAGLASSGVDLNLSKMGIQAGDDLFEIAYGHLGDEDDDRQSMSMDDFERVLEFQLDKLQRKTVAIAGLYVLTVRIGLGCRVPDDMQVQLRAMFGSTGALPRQSHLVRFFDAWRAGDYTTAFDNIHRYYDYAMQTREKVHYQYALLHMAILQAEFGCFGEAIAAINETIATARENQDMTCLSFSLSWLQHMSNAYPRQMKGAGYKGVLGSERDGLAFLKVKAKEAGMYSLLSATLLNEAKLCMSTVST